MLERVNLKGHDRDRVAGDGPSQGDASLTGPEARALLRQMPGYFCVLRCPARVVASANEALLQFADRALVGMAFDLTPMAAWSGLHDAVERAIAAGDRCSVAGVAVTSVQSGSPEQRFLDLAVEPLRCDAGSVIGVAIHGTDVTERVRAADVLCATHGWAESILDVLGDGFVAFDEDFRVVKMNAAALRYDGREEHEILGKTHWEAWPTSAGSFLEVEYARCLAEQVQISIERRYLGFGKDRWLELRLCPVRGGIVTFYRDVTDRKLSEAALRASEERYRALVEAVPHLVWEAGPDGNVEWFNGRFGTYIGATIEELRQGAWRRVLHPEDYGAVAEAWKRAQENGAIFEGEIRLRRQKDDAFRWFLSKAVPVRNADGEVIRWIGTNTDIHDEKTAASELVRRNSKLEETVEASLRDRERMWRLSTDLMLVASRDGTILTTNPAWGPALGWGAADLAGTSFLDLVHPDERGPLEVAVAKLAAGAPRGNLPIQLRHRDGSYRWIAWTGVPDEQFVHAVGRDITAEKTAAAALRKTEEALRQSQKMEAVGQLTGGIAHDFNNLLTGVIGSLDLLETRMAKGRVDDVVRYVEAAKSSAYRAAALTHRLLAFSRRQPLDPRPVDIGEMVTSMDELFRRTMGESIRVVFAASGDLWLTLSDPNQLESSLLNLVINARDAMGDGGTIVIESANVSVGETSHVSNADFHPGEYVTLSVTDTGCGMPPEVIDRVFEPFFTTKPIGQGTGLGLSMVYGFVKQSGGHVDIASAPGEGTTVRIYLPRYRGEAPRKPATTPPRAARLATDETILVVEDEAVVRTLVVEMLRELGYRVLEAEDGPSALRILNEARGVDLLLTDFGLPGLNGRQLADAARERRPDLKVLFMTGYVDNKILIAGFLGPRMEVIAKPFAADALAARVDRMIRG